MNNKINDAEWLVAVPEGQTFTSALTAACKGNDKLANTLNYFLFEATREAKRQGINKNDVECIEIKRKLDDILRGLTKYNKSTNKKTLHSRIVNLTEMVFLQSDSYHSTYRVMVKNIQAAITTPPEAEKPKPRGKYARKPTSEETLDDNEDGNFDSKGKFTISHPEMVNLRAQMVDLRSQMVNLQSEMVDLRSQMVNLQSELSCEKAARADLEAKLDPRYSNRYSNDIDIDTVSTAAVAASVPASPKPSRKLTSIKGNGTKQPNLLTENSGIALSDEEQRIYELWCDIPKHGGYREPITATMKERFGQLAPIIKTQEEMTSLYDYVRKLKYMSGKAIHPGNLATNYRGWHSMLPDKKPDTASQDPKPEDDQRVIIWSRKTTVRASTAKANWWLYEHMTIAEAKQYGYEDGDDFPPSIAFDIANRLELLADGTISLPPEAMSVA